MKRREMLTCMQRLAEPVLCAASDGRLKEKMKLEIQPIPDKNKKERLELDRSNFSALEAVARLLCGIAPWLDAAAEMEEERLLQAEYRKMAVESIQQLLDENSGDYLDISGYTYQYCQVLVDLAFLALAVVRAPKTLIRDLPEDTASKLVQLWERSREIRPGYCNWLLFSAIIECGIYAFKGKCDIVRVDLAVRQFEQWYLGDGVYSDGPGFAADYYNSFVIQPMLVTTARILPHVVDKPLWDKIQKRAMRYAALQERSIASDGSFPVWGRSIVYRAGCFHLLAQSAWMKELPEELSPAQVREALSAVVKRTLSPENYREDGFLNLGLCAHQPHMAEFYCSTGSLYLTSTVFLPLGLPAEDEFWSGEDQPWTQKKIWCGEDVWADSKIND